MARNNIGTLGCLLDPTTCYSSPRLCFADTYLTIENSPCQQMGGVFFATCYTDRFISPHYNNEKE